MIQAKQGAELERTQAWLEKPRQPLLNIFLICTGITSNGRVMLRNLQVIYSLLVVAFFPWVWAGIIRRQRRGACQSIRTYTLAARGRRLDIAGSDYISIPHLPNGIGA